MGPGSVQSGFEVIPCWSSDVTYSGSEFHGFSLSLSLCVPPPLSLSLSRRKEIVFGTPYVLMVFSISSCALLSWSVGPCQAYSEPLCIFHASTCSTRSDDPKSFCSTALDVLYPKPITVAFSSQVWNHLCSSSLHFTYFSSSPINLGCQTSCSLFLPPLCIA